MLFAKRVLKSVTCFCDCLSADGAVCQVFTQKACRLQNAYLRTYIRTYVSIVTPSSYFSVKRKRKGSLKTITVVASSTLNNTTPSVIELIIELVIHTITNYHSRCSTLCTHVPTIVYKIACKKHLQLVVLQQVTGVASNLGRVVSAGSLSLPSVFSQKQLLLQLGGLPRSHEPRVTYVQ